MTDEVEVQESEASETISDLFEPEVKETETEVETEVEAETETEGKGEAKAEVETESKETEAKAEEKEPPSDEGQSVPRKALLDERQKRQALEARLKELESKEPDANEPDPVDDPEGWKQYHKVKLAKEMWEERSNKSRDNMLSKHEDYEIKEKHFIFLTQQNPALISEMQAHHDPAGFAYEKASESLKQQETEIEKRVIERLEKEGKLKKPDDKLKSATEVSSLLNSTGAGKNSGEVEVLPENPGDYF